jgi:hypothetical protein
LGSGSSSELVRRSQMTSSRGSHPRCHLDCRDATALEWTALELDGPWCEVAARC